MRLAVYRMIKVVALGSGIIPVGGRGGGLIDRKRKLTPEPLMRDGQDLAADESSLQQEQGPNTK